FLRFQYLLGQTVIHLCNHPLPDSRSLIFATEATERQKEEKEGQVNYKSQKFLLLSIFNNYLPPPIIY
ncbi:MAG: hypothetical protein JSV88_11825, partial [Candidatus Aminicenantes bacterium]